MKISKIQLWSWRLDNLWDRFWRAEFLEVWISLQATLNHCFSIIELLIILIFFGLEFIKKSYYFILYIFWCCLLLLLLLCWHNFENFLLSIIFLWFYLVVWIFWVQIWESILCIIIEWNWLDHSFISLLWTHIVYVLNGACWPLPFTFFSCGL